MSGKTFVLMRPLTRVAGDLFLLGTAFVCGGVLSAVVVAAFSEKVLIAAGSFAASVVAMSAATTVALRRQIPNIARSADHEPRDATREAPQEALRRGVFLFICVTMPMTGAALSSFALLLHELSADEGWSVDFGLVAAVIGLGFASGAGAGLISGSKVVQGWEKETGRVLLWEAWPRRRRRTTEISTSRGGSRYYFGEVRRELEAPR